MTSRSRDWSQDYDGEDFSTPLVSDVPSPRSPYTRPMEETVDSAPAAEPDEPAPAGPLEGRGPVTEVYDRKEVYLRPDQAEALAALERALRRRRPRGVGERLTANTLVRVAVDLLLDRQDRLAGYTEADLRASVGLGGRLGR